jgi:hypothetical protein
MAKEKVSTGWKNLRVSLPGVDLPAKIYTVLSVRDAIQDYIRDMRLSPMRQATEFVVEEAR